MGTLATTALVGIGLNALFGLAGEVSLGQGGFLALGAYGVGILTTKAGFGFWEALPLAVLLVAAISAGVSLSPPSPAWAFLSLVALSLRRPSPGSSRSREGASPCGRGRPARPPAPP